MTPHEEKPELIVVHQQPEDVFEAEHSRGGLIEEADLLEAVKSGKLLATGLDSFTIEPMTAPHMFHGVPGIILTPHTGGVATSCKQPLVTGSTSTAGRSA